ncbi:HD-GYP domain-containing protein [Derxia gummosa]|uniref:HD-GYP domain-containing protein n=1 Tax=Derxia gummosa DSM 723 TaxID=1121388 RepID=A0A8B6XAC6_9BURK|nr:HD-GYP domain-containing protein [Derxia gummosa]
MTSLLKIPAREARLGMFVHDIDRSWWSHDFLRARFLIEDDETLDKVRQLGKGDIVIDLSRSIELDRLAPAAATEPVAPPPCVAEPPPAPPRHAWLDAAPTSFENELAAARKLHARARGLIRETMREARLGQIGELPEVQSLAEDMVSSVMRNAGALVSLIGLKSKDDYTFMHSVAVGTLMIALGRQCDLSPEQLRAAGLAGLLHDVGKTRVPDAVLNKPGKLTPDEFAMIKLHPVTGHRLLMEAGHGDAATLDVVLRHHERLDGTGYPDGLKGDEISTLARISSIADVYDAVTSERCYHRAQPPTAVLRMLMKNVGTHFDDKLVRVFVKCVGIYPTGCLVRLESQRLAVVGEQHPTNALTPRVRVFFSLKSQSHVPVREIDLARSEDRIASFEDPRTWGFDLSRY